MKHTVSHIAILLITWMWCSAVQASELSALRVASEYYPQNYSRLLQEFGIKFVKETQEMIFLNGEFTGIKDCKVIINKNSSNAISGIYILYPDREKPSLLTSDFKNARKKCIQEFGKPTSDKKTECVWDWDEAMLLVYIYKGENVAIAYQINDDIQAKPHYSHKSDRSDVNINDAILFAQSTSTQTNRENKKGLIEYAAAIVAKADDYYQNKEYEKAQIYYYYAICTWVKFYDTNYPEEYDYVLLRYKEIDDLYPKHNSHFYELQAQIAKLFIGEKSDDYALALYHLASAYKNEDHYSKSISACMDALPLFESIAGKTHPDYANILSILGYDYCGLEKFETALSYYQQALTIRQNYYGKNTMSSGALLANIGMIYNDNGDYKRALDAYRQAETVFTDSLLYPSAQPDLATVWTNMVAVFIHVHDYKNAKLYCTKSLRLRKSIYGELHPGYAMGLVSRGNLYNSMGNYNEAKKDYLQAIDILQNDSSADILKMLSDITTNIGAVCNSEGDYRNAEAYCMRALELSKQCYGDNHSKYASALLNAGEFYFLIGDYSQAIAYNKQAMEIYDNLQIIPKLLITLRNIGYMYCHVDDIVQAESYVRKALDLSANTFGTDDIHYADALESAARIYTSKQEWSLARDYLFEAEKIKKQKKALNSSDYPALLANISVTYSNDGKYAKSLEYDLKSYHLYQKIYPYGHPHFTLTINNIGHTYYAMGQYKNAYSYYRQARDSFRTQFVKSLDFLSERQREMYWMTIKRKFEQDYPVFTYRYYSHDKRIATFAYDNELFLKGLLLHSSSTIKHSVYGSGDTLLITQYEQLCQLKNLMNKLDEDAAAASLKEQYQQQAEQLEKQLTRSSAAFRNNEDVWHVDWKSIRDHLQIGEVAIEFSRVPVDEDTTQYVALILRKDNDYPIFVPLFDERNLLAKLNVSSTPSAYADSLFNYAYNGGYLSHLIWGNILPYIKRGETIFFAPAWLLHQIAIENLPYNSEQTMGDVYNMVRLSSTRELVLPKPTVSYTRAALHGGIKYNTHPEELSIEHKKYETSNLPSYNRGYTPKDAKRSVALDLPGTKKEIKDIQEILNKAHIQVQCKSAENATEESFKVLSGTHQNIIHLATHGFYWSDTTAQGQKFFKQWRAFIADDYDGAKAIDPLNRCGLLFAGANTALAGHRERLNEGVEDGILTANEISTLDFRDADIVVLSACETGLGDITGEGVFGLQRAFKMAGAQTIIMSLWKVDDKATQLLMTEFYRNWMDRKQAKREAFRNAQNYVRRKYTSPVFWAGFILLD